MRKRQSWKVLMLSALVGLSGCGGHDKGTTAEGTLPEVEVRTTAADAENRTRKVELPGTLYPSDQAIIASKLMATVAEAPVTIGQQVKAGDLLIRLEAGEIDAQVEQAEAALAMLQRNLEREQVLLAQSATTAEAVRSLEDEIRLARARLAEAQTMESYMQIRAPFDGVITSKEVKRGDLASPGIPLLNLEGIDNLEVQVEVPDSLNAVPYGETIRISDGKQFHEAVVSEWSPAANPTSRTRLAKLELPEGLPLRSGQYVRVEWPAGERRVLLLPASSITTLGQMDRVFVYAAGQLELRIVKTGDRWNDHVEILAGLKDTETVVLDPEPTLRDGQPAKEIN